MLDERKIQLVTQLLSGENKTNVAKKIGVSRQTVYEWLQDPEVIEEMKNRREELIQAGNEKLSSRLDTYLEVLHGLATSSTDKRTQATCAMYLTDRILGKVPAAIEVPNNKNENVPKDILESEFEEVDQEEEKSLKIVK